MQFFCKRNFYLLPKIMAGIALHNNAAIMIYSIQTK